MKKIYLLGLVLAIFHNINAQDCAGGRYGSDLFNGSDLTSNILYGSNVNYNGTPQDLFLDVYQPAGDVATDRPLVIFIHGGSFIAGSKTEGDVVPLAKIYAKKGYVTSSISYRLGMNLPPNEKSASEAVMRATQDARAAVRFFKKSVKDDNNPYGIDTTNIFLVGSSAGGFVALHLAYLDEVSEIPSAIDLTDPSLVGGLEGNSGSPGHTSNVKAIVNIAGALGDTTWMENNSTPVLSLHGNADATVPFGSAMLKLFIFEIMEVDGSESVHIKAKNEGIKNCFKAEYGASHVPHQSIPAYLDTTEQYITQFLLSEVCNELEFCICNTSKDPIACHPLDGIASIQSIEMEALLQMYPNPAHTEVAISLEGLLIEKVVLTDVNGRTVVQMETSKNQINIDVSNLTQGVYFVNIKTKNGLLTRKLIIE